MMIDYQTLDARSVDNRWRRTTTLVDDDDAIWVLCFHCFPLLLIMDAVPFRNKMNMDGRSVGAEGGKCPVYDYACIEAICILVRYNQYLKMRSRA